MSGLAKQRSLRFGARAPLALGVAIGAVLWPQIAIAQQAAPLIKRLDDPTRAKVLAALAGLIILGMGMVLLAWLGARVVQRYRRGTSYFQPTRRPGEHEWARKPLNPREADRPNPES